MHQIHLLDLTVIAAYLLAVFYLGRRGTRRTGQTQEGYFLAGRKLGKVYQFFLNFGNSTDANGAVSTASLVYQQGVSGVWLGFQMIFLNPYYWFMNLWFRRVRLVTTADLFVDRLGSASLAKFYAVFQCLTAVVITLGFGNLVTYKISSALVVKAESSWTAAERASVEGHRELKMLERTVASQSLNDLEPSVHSRLITLREQDARGELHAAISPLEPWIFYLCYTLVVGSYVIMGGMAATAINEILQSCLIVVFSLIMIPLGLAAIGGAGVLSEKVPAEMFELLRSGGGGQHVTLLVLMGILANSLVQINGIPANMVISGSAKDEFAARFGATSGTYAKRLVIIMWAFCGLIGVALFQGHEALSDPDALWGVMSRQLLAPGLFGLMVTGILAANMSTVAAQSMAVAGLFVRNVYAPLRGRELSDRESVLAGRLTIVAVLALAVIGALMMSDVFSMLQFMLTINVPFGAAVILMFFWRRLTARAVWAAVALAFLVNTLSPILLPRLDFIRQHPALTTRTADEAGRFSAIYFDSVVRTDPADPMSLLEGRGRFHTELVLLDALGLDMEQLPGSTRYAARLFTAVLLPFVLLILVSWCTRPPPAERTAHFFGKMKTPVDPDPAADAHAMAETIRNPHRFDHLKLFPRSSWEFTKWNRVDAVGFVACCAVSAAVIALFWLLLRAAAA